MEPFSFDARLKYRFRFGLTVYLAGSYIHPGKVVLILSHVNCHHSIQLKRRRSFVTLLYSSSVVPS